MLFTAKKCGVNFKPPSVVVIYVESASGKTRKRIIPVRNFSQFSDCSKAAEQMKHNPRHRDYLECVSLGQLVKLHSILRDHLGGVSLEQSLVALGRDDTAEEDEEKFVTHLSEEDLNKLSDEELARRKADMDIVFEQNRKQKGDPDFVYDLEVEFPQLESQAPCSWDESDDGF